MIFHGHFPIYTRGMLGKVQLYLFIGFVLELSVYPKYAIYIFSDLPQNFKLLSQIIDNKRNVKIRRL